MHVNRRCNSWTQKCYWVRNWEDFRIQRPHNKNSAHVECESKSDTGNNRGNWNHLKIIHTMSDQHTRKARNQRSAKHSHIGLCTHTAESTNVKVHNIFHGRSNIMCKRNFKCRKVATFLPYKHGFFQVHKCKSPALRW